MVCWLPLQSHNLRCFHLHIFAKHQSMDLGMDLNPEGELRQNDTMPGKDPCLIARKSGEGKKEEIMGCQHTFAVALVVP